MSRTVPYLVRIEWGCPNCSSENSGAANYDGSDPVMPGPFKCDGCDWKLHIMYQAVGKK